LIKICCFQKLAAKRYGKYWTKRVAAFGAEKAFLPMTLSGALSDPVDQIAMATGCVEIVENCTDKMGRGAMIIDSGRLSNPAISTDSIIRTIFYMAEAALSEHDDVQKYGGIIFGRPPSGGISDFSMVSSRMKKVVKYCVGTIPFRLSAYHIVQPPYYLRPIISIAMLLLKESTKKRLRCHTGSNEELLAELEADGLSRETLPEYVGGNAKFDMAAWIEGRRAAGK
jgi:CRAL/TRIO domain